MNASLPSDREILIRSYAAGDMTWRELQERGFEDYVQVLGGLGELGLRPPTARMIGPNMEARQRGLTMIQRLLANTPHSRVTPSD